MSLHINRPESFAAAPEAIIFDTDNTLYEYKPAHRRAIDAAQAKACKLLGVSPKEFLAAFDGARTDVKRQLGKTAASHSRLLYFQRAIERLGMKTQLLMTLDIEQTYWRTFLTSSTLFPEAREFILDLRSAAIRSAVITDLTAQIQFRKLIYFGLDDLFDYVVTSEEAGADKPAAVAFQLAVAKLQVAPEKIWMIGDDPSADISGAKAFSMAALQKRHKDVAIGLQEEAPDLVFDEFQELRDFMRKRGWISGNP